MHCPSQGEGVQEIPLPTCARPCGSVQRETPPPLAHSAHQGPCRALRHHGVGLPLQRQGAGIAYVQPPKGASA